MKFREKVKRSCKPVWALKPGISVTNLGHPPKIQGCLQDDCQGGRDHIAEIYLLDDVMTIEEPSGQSPWAASLGTTGRTARNPKEKPGLHRYFYASKI
jgi:hypothetical protein